ncbi:uncharacterized protein LOC136036176 [Artemia franciscana]|uniref:uncharacterized protein LOC136036176 n=1 Tax=Artemia franciscana TaxID=6661 RepID=UPI0032DA86BD
MIRKQLTKNSGIQNLRTLTRELDRKNTKDSSAVDTIAQFSSLGYLELLRMVARFKKCGVCITQCCVAIINALGNCLANQRLVRVESQIYYTNCPINEDLQGQGF